MNEDQDIHPQTPAAASMPPADLGSTDDEPAPTGERVFDISEDSISPITPGEAEAASSKTVPQQQPQPQSEARPPANQPIRIVHSKPVGIPLQDISDALARAHIKPVDQTPVSPHQQDPAPKPQPVPKPTPTPQTVTSSGIPQLVETPDKDPNRSKPPFPGIRPTAAAADINKPPVAPVFKAIRTYESDVAEVLARTKASTASITLAENRQRTGKDLIGSTNKDASATPEDPHDAGPTHSGTKLLISLASLVLIAGGAFGAYYLYSQSPLAPAPEAPIVQSTVTSVIPPDSYVAVQIDSLVPIDVVSRVQSELSQAQEPGTIREIVFTRTSGDQKTRVGGPDMIGFMDIDAPDILVRSLTEPWMLGIYARPDGGKSIFVAVTTNFFQNAFAGMLQWENVMADDLKQYLYPTPIRGIYNEPAPIPTVTASSSETASTTDTAGTDSTASTTPAEPAISQYFTLRGRFDDRIVKNKDVRIFTTSGGETLFLYSFLDSSTMVMTSDTATLAAIVERLENQAFVR